MSDAVVMIWERAQQDNDSNFDNKDVGMVSWYLVWMPDLQQSTKTFDFQKIHQNRVFEFNRSFPTRQPLWMRCM